MISEGFILISLLISVSSDSIFSLVDPWEAKMIFYWNSKHRSHFKSYHIVDATSVLDHPKFVYPQTHCYIHDYNEHQGKDSIRAIVDAYRRRQINLLVVDWSLMVDADFFSAILNMINLGPVLSEKLLDLFNAGLPKDSFTLVGYSLGGQLAALIARSFIQQTNGKKLPVIWALDPSLPGFFPQDSVPYLKTIEKDDAEFTAIIHTDISNYGQVMPRGLVDFYPNGGLRSQPGCPSGIFAPFSEEDLCSHKKSWQFWAEDIKLTDDLKFYAFPAASYDEFLQLGIENITDRAIVMGMDCPKSARGTYYLQTNARPRYAKGFDGY